MQMSLTLLVMPAVIVNVINTSEHNVVNLINEQFDKNVSFDIYALNNKI